MTTVLPAMSSAQASSWHALLDLYDEHPTGWTLVGGQMVHLHCAERGTAPQRPTDDVDTLLDVRAEPHVLLAVTGILHDRGFRPAGETWTGLERLALAMGAAPTSTPRRRRGRNPLRLVTGQQPTDGAHDEGASSRDSGRDCPQMPDRS